MFSSSAGMPRVHAAGPKEKPFLAIADFLDDFRKHRMAEPLPEPDRPCVRAKIPRISLEIQWNQFYVFGNPAVTADN